MIPATFPNWGERSWLFDKSLQYIMSLDLLYELPIHPDAVVGTTTRLPMLAVPPPGPDRDLADKWATTYRTSGPPLFRGVDNIEREVPEARLVRGQDGLTLREEGGVELDGHLLLEVDTTEPIVLSYKGVLTLSGGTMQLARPRVPTKPKSQLASAARDGTTESYIGGTAFVATRQEVSIPKYRWLSFNQFIGIGRVKAFAPLHDDVDPWLISMSFDLYLGL
jgi:hypothetical protein